MSPKDRLPSLDLLRFVAVFIVICVHTLPMPSTVYGPTIGELT